MTTIGIDGLGYMGLATGLGFARHGWDVLGFDINPATRTSLGRGKSVYHEPGLEALLRAQVKAGRFRVVDTVDQLVRESEGIFLCLPTPSRRDGSIDLRAIRQGSRTLSQSLRATDEFRVVVVKSTVVPGTTESVVAPILRAGRRTTSPRLGVASNPEFLAEGTMVHDAVHPARIVIGTSDPRTDRWLREVYAPFNAPILSLSPAGAELVKYASNAFLATKVTFANEVSRLAERVGVDIDAVMGAVGEDPRIGRLFLRAGPGFGGSCFDKDLRALAHLGHELGLPLRLWEATLAANDDRLGQIRELVRRAAGSIRRKRVAVLGLAFKAGTDDVRESRAFPIIEFLRREGASVRVHDPQAADRFRAAWKATHPRDSEGIRYVAAPSEALRGADLAILHTDWASYREWPASWTKSMRRPRIVDLRRALPWKRLERQGAFVVALGVGRTGAAATR